MTKTLKMSLVAAVAVAGVSSTVSAKPLEEAIKNTDLSGYIRYRYTNGEAQSESNAYKTVFKVKSKVNDNVSAFMKVAGEAATSNTSGDADPDNDGIKEAKFIMNMAGATVIAGKQGLESPFAAKSDQQGTGVVALYPAGPVTIAAGWYTNSDASSIYNKTLNSDGDGGANNNDIGGNNITALAAIGKAGPVDYSVWYAQVSESNINDGSGLHATAKAGASAYNINVKGAFGPANVEFNHASVDYSLNTDAATLADELNPTQTRLVAGMEAGPATVSAGYVMTGDEGGNVGLGDGDESANFLVEDISANALADASLFYIGAKATFSGVKLGLDYVDGDGKGVEVNNKAGKSNWTKIDASELMVSACYAMSKNFKISGFITDGETQAAGADAAKTDKTRVEIKYTF